MPSQLRISGSCEDALSPLVHQPSTKFLTDGKQDVLQQITWVAEQELIAQQQLAGFKETLKLHNNTILMRRSTTEI